MIQPKSKGTYVAFKVKNGDQLVSFCNSLGIEVSKPDELHVTVSYSRTTFNMNMFPDEEFVIPPGHSHFSLLNNCLVLKLDSVKLHSEFIRAKNHGATYDYPTYQPHITIQYDSTITPHQLIRLKNPDFDIVLGDQYIEPLNLDWLEN